MVKLIQSREHRCWNDINLKEELIFVWCKLDLSYFKLVHVGDQFKNYYDK